MKTSRKYDKIWRSLALSGAAMLGISVGCSGTSTDGERAARQDQETIEKVYRPDGQRPRVADGLDEGAAIRIARDHGRTAVAAAQDALAGVEVESVLHGLPLGAVAFEAAVHQDGPDVPLEEVDALLCLNEEDEREPDHAIT